eukprot:6179463-Pleurochrysis_carterae.AAC.1
MRARLASFALRRISPQLLARLAPLVLHGLLEPRPSHLAQLLPLTFAALASSHERRGRVSLAEDDAIARVVAARPCARRDLAQKQTCAQRACSSYACRSCACASRWWSAQQLRRRREETQPRGCASKSPSP